MKIKLKTIPHNKQRYPTVGDWIVKDKTLNAIMISDMGNENYAFLVAVHELVEAWLCLKKGVDQDSVDEFDKDYERARKLNISAPCGCKPTRDSEPGFDNHAPYRNEHSFATKIERMLAKKLNIDWDKYDKVVSNL